MSSVPQTPSTLIRRAKLRYPRFIAGLVFRPRLTDRLSASLAAPLTLISAPAGFGKTTLLADWRSSLTSPVAWLTADAGDRESRRFVAHLIASLERVTPETDFGDALNVFEMPQPAPARDVAEALADKLWDLPCHTVLVIDDYQLAASAEVENVIGGLLELAPPELHVVLATRVDPALPLARMRLQDRIIEIRGDDLRFSDDEIQALLSASGKPAGDPTILAQVRAVTGGWAAGVRLAALALPEGVDPTRIADAIAGDQHLMAFLVEEVLAKQRVQVQDFLLRTAIVSRVSAGLGDALIDGQPPGGCAAMLESLAQEQVFFEPDADDAGWFRHRPLFHDLLRHQLEVRASPAAPAELHARASAWFAADGQIAEAIFHGLAAGDTAGAVSLVEQHRHAVLARDDWPSLAGWLEMLPAHLLVEHPTLLLARAWVLHFSGHSVAVRELMHEVRALLSRENPESAAVAEMLAECDVLELGHLVTTDEDPQRIMERALGAAERVAIDHRFARGLAYVVGGCALQTIGQTEEAVRWLTAIADRESERIDAGSIRALMGLVFVHRQAGSYYACREVASHMLELAERHELPVAAGWARWALGWVAYEHNELDTAITHFTSIARDWLRLNLSCVGEGLFGLALAYQASGKPLEARGALRQLTDAVHDQHAVALLPSLHLFEARLTLLGGRTQPNLESVYAYDVALEGTSLFSFEHELLSRAKVLLAAGSHEALATAWHDIDVLRASAEAGHHRARLVEILALASLICAARGQREPALDYLRRSLELGVPAGFFRTYVDFGPAITPLLAQLAGHGVRKPYVDRLLEAINAESRAGRLETMTPATSSAHMLDRLTVRETEVLDALARRLSYQEIADELFVSVNTVKSHTAHIYDKLGAANRRQAVARADSLGLLTRVETTHRRS